MARACAPCNYYTRNADESVCPSCGVPLRLTLLPPPGQAADPLADVPAPSPAGRGARPGESGSGQLGDLLRWVVDHWKLVSTAVVPVLLILALLTGWHRGDLKGRYDRIEVGMTEDEVRAILTPPQRGRFRRPSWYAESRLATSGPADMSWQEGKATIKIHFMDGLVVSKSQQGLD
jgi:hypothetical protein